MIMESPVRSRPAKVATHDLTKEREKSAKDCAALPNKVTFCTAVGKKMPQTREDLCMHVEE